MKHERESRRRVRFDLSNGAYMDVCLSPDCSAEDREALRQFGETVAARMRAGTLPPHKSSPGLMSGAADREGQPQERQ